MANSYTLGAGFESFKALMDTEAEATVKINQTDGDSDAGLDTPDTAPETVEDVEVNAAEDEQKTEDLESASDEINQTMKYTNRLMAQYDRLEDLKNYFKNNEADRITLEFIDTNYGIISGLKGRVEAFNPSSAKHKQDMIRALEDNQQNIWQRIAQTAQDLWERIKKVWDRVVAFLSEKASKLIEMIQRLFGPGTGILKDVSRIDYPDDIEVPDYDKAINACDVFAGTNFDAMANELKIRVFSVRISKNMFNPDALRGVMKKYVDKTIQLDQSADVKINSSKWTDPKNVLAFAEKAKPFIGIDKKIANVEKVLENALQSISKNKDEGTAKTGQAVIQQVQQMFTVLQNNRFMPAMKALQGGQKVVTEAIKAAKAAKDKQAEANKASSNAGPQGQPAGATA